MGSHPVFLAQEKLYVVYSLHKVVYILFLCSLHLVFISPGEVYSLYSKTCL